LSRPICRLAVPLLSALCLVALPAMPPSPPVHIATSPVASGGWLTRFNTWRASTGLPLLTENSTWSAGDYNHAVYMVKNDLVTHYETPGVPYYTIDGDTAARNSNIFVSSSTSTTDDQAIDWWMQAPFHAMGMMDPRLSQTGFGSYREVKSGWDLGAAVDVLRGNSFSGGQYPVYFPGNGASEPLTSYGGGEFPDPLQACPGYSVPTGLPVFIQVGGNVSTVAGPVHSFTGNGVPLNHCVIDSTNPAVGSNLVARGGVILIPQSPLQVGVRYVVTLTVNGQPYTWSFMVGAFSGCPFVTQSAAPPSPSVSRTTVSVTASAPACPNPLYQFWTLAPGATSWALAQAYSTSNTLTWTTVGKAPGTYQIAVWARDAASTGIFGNQFGRWDAFNSIAYQLTSTACTGLSLSAAPPTTTTVGASPTFTATSTCPDANPVYQFWVLAPGATSWALAQAYSTSNALTWSTVGRTPGAYQVAAWVRDASSAGASGNQFGTWDVFSSINYTLVSTACTALSLSAAPPATTTVGTSPTFTAASTCPDANPVYQFWFLAPGASSWTLAQAYSTSNTLSWSTVGKAPGAYQLGAWVRDAGSAGASGNQFGSWDVFNSIPYQLTTTACTGLSLSAAPPATTTVGASATITATSTCPDASPVYQFWFLAPGAPSWTLAQAYSTIKILTWSTTGKAPGAYQIAAWVRDAGSAGASSNQFGTWDVFTAIPYQLTTTACTGLSLSAAPPAAATVGASATITASSTCPDANPVYQFWVLAPGAPSWALAQAYSTSNTYIWSTAGKAPGNYQVAAWVRDASSAGASSNQFGTWDVFASRPYTVTTCTGLSLSSAPPSTATVGTSVTFMATANGCPNPNPVYQFWVLAPGASSWTLVQAYSTSNTFIWSTAGKAPGNYQVAVWVRDASSAGASSNQFGTWDVFGATQFTLT
jgi:Cysteine-rich secretory protein family